MALKKGVLKFIYKISYLLGKPVYEKYLFNEVKSNDLPRHVGIILDGNRRYAMERKMDPRWGHEEGAKKLEEVLEWCLSLGIRYVTVYAFSTENICRSQEEVNHLFKLIERKLREVSNNERIHKNKVKIKILGCKEKMPEKLRGAAEKAEKATEKYSNYILNVCILYGGRQEIVDAVKEIARKVEKGCIKPEEINEKLIERHLYTKGLPDPDLIIRTSGEERLSGFLIWQSAYSELYFCETYFPAFRKIDFLRAIRSYQERSRRFGR